MHKMFSRVGLRHMDFLKYSGKVMHTDETALYSPSGLITGLRDYLLRFGCINYAIFIVMPSDNGMKVYHSVRLIRTILSYNPFSGFREKLFR